MKRLYREVISGYLRSEGVSPVPIRRLAVEHPQRRRPRIQKLLKKPHFCWERDGEALLRKYKADWYAEPPLPRVTPVSPELARRFHAAHT